MTAGAVKKVVVSITWLLDGEEKTQVLEYGEGYEIEASISQSAAYLRGFSSAAPDAAADFKRSGLSALAVLVQARNLAQAAECDEWKKDRWDVSDVPTPGAPGPKGETT